MTNNLLIVLLISFLMFACFFVIGETFLPSYIKKFRAYFAPVVGYAIYSYIFFLLFYFTTNTFIVWLVNILLIVISICVFLKRKNYPSCKYFISIFFPLGIACYITYILSLKYNSGDIILSEQVFDHMKVAITTSILREGLPLQNPFCAFPSQLFYFFLYYVPNAVISISFKVSAYESELISLIVTTLTGIGAMFGTLSVLKKKECSYGEMAILTLFILTGSITAVFPYILTTNHGFDSILTTLTWTPQTFIAISYLLLVSIIIYENELKHILLPAFLLAVIAGTSIYIALVAALSLGMFFLVNIFIQHSWVNFKPLFYLSLLGLVLSFPFLFNQVGVMHSHGFPVGVHIYPWSTLTNPFFQIIGFWTVYYFIQSPVIFIINISFLKINFIKKYSIFYCLIFISILITCFFKTTIENNDLGWRAIFVSIVIFTIFAGYYFSLIKRKIISYGIIMLALVCSFSSFELLINSMKAPIRYLSKESLQAIEKHIAPQDYFLNNIIVVHSYGLARLGNLDFIIWSNRKSCYSGFFQVNAFCNLTLRSYQDTVSRIFQKDIRQEDIEIARRINCNKFIFHYTDPNFKKDKELEAAGLNKIYQNEQIKIYE